MAWGKVTNSSAIISAAHTTLDVGTQLHTCTSIGYFGFEQFNYLYLLMHILLPICTHLKHQYTNIIWLNNGRHILLFKTNHGSYFKYTIFSVVNQNIDSRTSVR
jgi:hypothetical protein